MFSRRALASGSFSDCDWLKYNPPTLAHPCHGSFPFLTFTFTRLYKNMSISSILKRAITKHFSHNKTIFSIYNTPKRKNFLLAPAFAYSVDSCRLEAKLPQNKTIVSEFLAGQKTKFTSNNGTKLHMSRQWLQYMGKRRMVHSKSTPPTPPPLYSKEELLAQARGFFDRLKIRIKYPLMRQIRPWTLNDATALFSWLFLGHTVWLLVGTTSFVSLILWLANSLQFQGKKKKKLYIFVRSVL